MMTAGLNHLGLSVKDLDQTTKFFVDVLGWEETARDPSYPRNAITDGSLRLTLWQITDPGDSVPFDKRKNIGLHHLALTVGTSEVLDKAADMIAAYPGTEIEFMPELMGSGPRKHMMFREPGGLRIELTWPGN